MQRESVAKAAEAERKPDAPASGAARGAGARGMIPRCSCSGGRQPRGPAFSCKAKLRTGRRYNRC
jgi:hypothetical protein